MPNHKPATTAPYDPGECRWVFTQDGRFPIVSVGRRRVMIDRYGDLVTLRRRDLETTGITIAGKTTYRMSSYRLPDETENIA